MEHTTPSADLTCYSGDDLGAIDRGVKRSIEQFTQGHPGGAVVRLHVTTADHAAQLATSDLFSPTRLAVVELDEHATPEALDFLLSGQVAAGTRVICRLGSPAGVLRRKVTAAGGAWVTCSRPVRSDAATARVRQATQDFGIHLDAEAVRMMAERAMVDVTRVDSALACCALLGQTRPSSATLQVLLGTTPPDVFAYQVVLWLRQQDLPALLGHAVQPHVQPAAVLGLLTRHFMLASAAPFDATWAKEAGFTAYAQQQAQASADHWGARQCAMSWARCAQAMTQVREGGVPALMSALLDLAVPAAGTLAQ